MTTHTEWAPPSAPRTTPAPSYPPTRKKGGGFWVALAILLGGAAVVGVLVNAPDDGKVGPGSRSGGNAGTQVTSPKADLNDIERSLYRSGSYYDCNPVAKGSLMSGANAGITCDASRGKNATAQTVEYYKFGKNSTMTAEYNARLAALESTPGVTVVTERSWCLTSFGMPCYTSDGRAMFYRKGDTVHAEWTYFPNKTYSTAVRKGPNMSAIRSLWRGAGPD